MSLPTSRLSNNYVISSYTWAKSIDTTGGIRVQGFDTLYPQNSYCLACERGPSAFDTKHRMETSALCDLPVGEGKRLGITNPIANTLIGGWDLGGILTLQSGMPGNEHAPAPIRTEVLVLTRSTLSRGPMAEPGVPRPSNVTTKRSFVFGWALL
jgi:hypothetical protein